MTSSTWTTTPNRSSSMNYVRFDVGHFLYVCHKTTILKFEDSVLAKYVAPEFDTRKTEFEYIVIDRDGKHFGTILNYMRDETSLDLDRFTDSDLMDLMREADFYCLSGLVEICEKEFELRELQAQQESQDKEASQLKFNVPPGNKLEIIFGLDIMKHLLSTSTKPTIVISYRSMRRFHIDSWIEELLKLCDHKRFKVYCFSNKSDEMIDSALSEFIMSLYDPVENNFPMILSAPSYEKFRARRLHYKCKINKFWFKIQIAR